MYENSTDKSMNKRNLLVSVAKMYYLQNMTQQEIADQLFLSRSNVSRLLKACVDQHIVEFYINETSSSGQELQQTLKRRFGLRDAIVIPSQDSTESTKEKLGESVTMYLRSYLHNDISLGVAWGTTLHHISMAFRPLPDISIDVVQLVGGRGSKSMDTDGMEIAKRIARCLNGNAYIPYVPFIVKERKLKELLFEEPDVRNHFERANNVDIALVGIGSATRTLSSAKRAGYLSDQDIDMLEKAGSVADICGIQIDKNGDFCAPQFDERRVGVSYEGLANIPFVLGACVGANKTDAVLAALKSRLIDVLAIDEDAAFSVLEMFDQN